MELGGHTDGCLAGPLEGYTLEEQNGKYIVNRRDSFLNDDDQTTAETEE